MEYRWRAGIEGTLSAGARAMHLVRLGAWLAGEPLAHTRWSSFVRLMAQLACA